VSPLRLDAEAGSLLALRGNPQIGDHPLHVQTAYHRMRTGRSAKSSNVIALFCVAQRHGRRDMRAGSQRCDVRDSRAVAGCFKYSAAEWRVAFLGAHVRLTAPVQA
jgi:hypothetical protein